MKKKNIIILTSIVVVIILLVALIFGIVTRLGNKKTDDNEVTEITTNDKGSVAILKVDEEENPIEGVEFNVYDINGNFVHNMTTKENGITGLENLPLGKYYMEEVSGPEQYEIDATKRYFEIETAGQTLPIKIVSSKEKGKLAITTYDNTGKTLAGVTFEVKDEDNNLVDTITTDENGFAQTVGLALGEYYYTEVKVPENVIIDTEKHHFILNENDQVIKKTIVNEYEGV